MTFSTPLAQAGGEVFRRFVFGQLPSNQSLEVVNWSDALLSGQFFKGKRGYAFRSRRPDWLCDLVHESRIANQRPLSVPAMTAWCRDRRLPGGIRQDTAIRSRSERSSSVRVARYPDTASRRDWTNHESYNQAGPRPDQVESLASTSRVERLEVTDSPRRRPEFPAVRSTRSRSALARTNSRRPARSN